VADSNFARSESWPILIAIDGPSGSGKSTLLRTVERELASRSVTFRSASNNDVGAWGGLIRSLAKRSDLPTALALATAGARAELRETADRPILCDRFALSTFVYQRFAGLSFDYLYAVNQPLFVRSVTFALMAAPELLVVRRGKQEAELRDLFKDGLDVHAEVKLYEEAIDELRRRNHDVRKVDASDGVNELTQELAPEIAVLMRSDASK
jgi:thymidylate kinase